MYIMCYTMLVQRFEPQGRRFTNFHHYYYQQHTVTQTMTHSPNAASAFSMSTALSSKSGLYTLKARLPESTHAQSLNSKNDSYTKKI